MRFILAVFALGIVLPLLLTFINFRPVFVGASQPIWVILVGFWLFSLGINHIPLFTCAAISARKDSVRESRSPNKLMSIALERFGGICGTPT